MSRFAGSKVPARPSLELWNASNGTKSAAKLITRIQTNRDSALLLLVHKASAYLNAPTLHQKRKFAICQINLEAAA
ncbi:MAG: hypothetical protein DMF15_12905 [Verrucomicrobia bacterium]|nr:MAG: hypothetical protein DMF15_12905 [Verrucomicrobiota bacterium]